MGLKQEMVLLLVGLQILIVKRPGLQIPVSGSAARNIRESGVLLLGGLQILILKRPGLQIPVSGTEHPIKRGYNQYFYEILQIQNHRYMICTLILRVCILIQCCYPG